MRESRGTNGEITRQILRIREPPIDRIAAQSFRVNADQNSPRHAAAIGNETQNRQVILGTRVIDGEIEGLESAQWRRARGIHLHHARAAEDQELRLWLRLGEE